MSTPNPLAPQGSLLEQHPKGRSMFQVISLIGVVHVMLLCGILWTACSRDDKTKAEPPNTLGSDPYSSPPTDPGTGLPVVSNNASNLAASLPATPAGPSATDPLPGYNPPASSTVQPPPGGGTAAPPVGPAPALPPATANILPPPATDAAPSSAAGEYKVAKGDIGASIARAHGVTLKALTAANPTVNWSRLKVGQTLQIPASTGAAPSTAAGSDSGPSSSGQSYTVKAGDTGTKIATKHGVKWAEIRRASNLKSDVLRPGQKLTIPTRAGSSAGDTTTPGTSQTPTAVPAPRGAGQ